MSEQEYMARAEAVKARLYRTARCYLGGGALAVDAVDEAVYKGFWAYKKLRRPELFDAWITRILINVCNTELRRRGREVAVENRPRRFGAQIVPRFFAQLYRDMGKYKKNAHVLLKVCLYIVTL